MIKLWGWSFEKELSVREEKFGIYLKKVIIENAKMSENFEKEREEIKIGWVLELGGVWV